MKVSYLVANIYSLGGTERAVITQANAMSRFHDVEIVSVYRDAHEPRFAISAEVSVQSLVSTVGGSVRLERSGLLQGDAARALHGRPSMLVPRAWDQMYDALADVGLEDALPRVKSDVVVTVTPALLAAATQLVPSSTAIVHQEHRSSSQRTAGMEPLLAFGPRADTIAVLTVSMAEWMAARLGTAAPWIEVVPNALPPGYRPRSRLDNPLIMAAGRLVTEKQYGQLIAAFGGISDRLPGWRLRIFGDGPSRQGLLGAIRRHGLFDQVELPGTSSDLAGEWAKASISALTSTTEALPLVVQEAMAAGVPVISYDCPSGPREMIDHGVDGLLVSQSSVAGLGAALYRLATDDSLRVTMGSAALARSASYDVDAINRRWMGIFEAAVDRRRRTRGGRSTRRIVATRLGDRSTRIGDPDEAPPGADGAGVSPAEARTTIVEVLSSAAAAVTTEWFVIPRGEVAPIVVVPSKDRRRFLDQLASGRIPAYVSMRDPEEGGWPERRGSITEMVEYLRTGMTSRLAFEPWPRVGGLPSLLGQGCTVWVQFWESGIDGDLHAPIPNQYVQYVPATSPEATTVVEGVVVPTLPLMVGPTVTDCSFPVDVVYTWVDGTDARWDERRRRRLAEITDDTMLAMSASGQARYTTRDELRYSMRSVHLFAPWVRTIHLVTDGQKPTWLRTEDPRVRLVDHLEILPEETLPTFNSQAIETALSRVPALAEHFIYFNDDVFLGRPVQPEMFFSPAGEFAVFPSSTVLGLPGQADRPYLKSGSNNRRLLHDAFGVTITQNLAHTPHPHRRSVLDEVTQRFAAEVEATARAPFRSDTDVSMLSSLAQHYGLITGTAFVGAAEHAIVNLTSHALRRQLDNLLRREHDFLCLGDHHDYALTPARIAGLVADFLESYFPVAAPWEVAVGATVTTAAT